MARYQVVNNPVGPEYPTPRQLEYLIVDTEFGRHYGGSPADGAVLAISTDGNHASWIVTALNRP